jgi:nucleoid DNA-binding protein
MAATKPRPMTKSDIYKELAEKTELSKKQIQGVFEQLTALIQRELKKKEPGVFVVPGLLKIKRVHKKASGPRPIRNPATGEMMMSKAKPARNVVRALALKGLKEMVAK